MPLFVRFLNWGIRCGCLDAFVLEGLPIALSMLLEILHFSLVLLCLLHGFESAKVPTLAGGGILFARIQAKLARFQLPNHEPIRCGGCARRCQACRSALRKASLAGPLGLLGILLCEKFRPNELDNSIPDQNIEGPGAEAHPDVTEFAARRT